MRLFCLGLMALVLVAGSALAADNINQANTQVSEAFTGNIVQGNLNLVPTLDGDGAIATQSSTQVGAAVGDVDQFGVNVIPDVTGNDAVVDQEVSQGGLSDDGSVTQIGVNALPDMEGSGLLTHQAVIQSSVSEGDSLQGAVNFVDATANPTDGSEFNQLVQQGVLSDGSAVQLQGNVVLATGDGVTANQFGAQAGIVQDDLFQLNVNFADIDGVDRTIAQNGLQAGISASGDITQLNVNLAVP